MALNAENASCYDVITEVDEAMQDVLSQDTVYVVLGGIVTKAINHPGTVFDHDAQRIIAHPESSLSLVREEEGTLRDIDELVLRVLSKKETKKIDEKLAEAVGHTLVTSVYGVKQHHDPHHIGSAVRAVRDWTSVRTVDQEGNHRYELFPLSQIVPLETYQPWKLEIPGSKGKTIQTLSPAAHMLAYHMRSISGVRPKDTEKVDAMTRRIYADEQFREEIHDGPLSAWKKFADGITALRTGQASSEDLPLFPNTGEFAKYGFKRKSELLYFLESNPTIVKYARTGLMQKILLRFIGSS